MHFLKSRRLIYKFMMLVMVAALQTACVTTTDSVFTQKANKSEAVDTYVQLGLAYIERDDYDRARKHLVRALAIDPKNAGALAAMGLVFQNDGEPALAEENFKKSIVEDPTFTRGRTYYAAYLYSEGRYQEAYDQFKQASTDTEFEGRAQIFRNMAL
jgi:type IV pilus assembly protein PilF